MPQHVGKPRGGGAQVAHGVSIPAFPQPCLSGRLLVLVSPACVPRCVRPLPGLHGLAPVSAKGFSQSVFWKGDAMSSSRRRLTE